MHHAGLVDDVLGVEEGVGVRDAIILLDGVKWDVRGEEVAAAGGLG